MLSKGVILIGIDNFDNFTKEHEIGTHSEAKSFSTIEISVTMVVEKLYEHYYKNFFQRQFFLAFHDSFQSSWNPPSLGMATRPKPMGPPRIRPDFDGENPS